MLKSETVLLAVCSASSPCHSLDHSSHLMVTRWLPEHHLCCCSRSRGKRAVPDPGHPFDQKSKSSNSLLQIGSQRYPGFKGTLETQAQGRREARNNCWVSQLIVTIKVSTYGAPTVCTQYLLEALHTLSYPSGSWVLCFIDRQGRQVFREISNNTVSNTGTRTPSTPAVGSVYSMYYCTMLATLLSFFHMLPMPSLSG